MFDDLVDVDGEPETTVLDWGAHPCQEHLVFVPAKCYLLKW